jgi:hypothetical protein
MNAVAVRQGQERQKGPRAFHHLATVECDHCGAAYSISHKRKRLKTIPTQVSELKAILADDHKPKNRREHPDLVELD